MKSTIFILTIFLFGSFSLANTENNPEIVKRPDGITITYLNQLDATTTELNKEDDALYCSVTVGDTTATCWFCSCSALLKELQAAEECLPD